MTFTLLMITAVNLLLLWRVFRALRTGQVAFRDNSVGQHMSYSRSSQPVRYWLILGLMVVFFLIALGTLALMLNQII